MVLLRMNWLQNKEKNSVVRICLEREAIQSLSASIFCETIPGAWVLVAAQELLYNPVKQWHDTPLLYHPVNARKFSHCRLVYSSEIRI